MRTRFKTISGALALTVMLLFSAVAFARTGNMNAAKPNMGSPEMPSARNDRWKKRRHRRHMRHTIRHERRELKRERKNR